MGAVIPCLFRSMCSPSANALMASDCSSPFPLSHPGLTPLLMLFSFFAQILNFLKNFCTFTVFCFMSTVFAFLYVCAYHIPPWYPKRREEGIRLPGARVRDACEFPDVLAGNQIQFSFLFFLFFFFTLTIN